MSSQKIPKSWPFKHAKHTFIHTNVQTIYISIPWMHETMFLKHKVGIISPLWLSKSPLHTVGHDCKCSTFTYEHDWILYIILHTLHIYIYTCILCHGCISISQALHMFTILFQLPLAHPSKTYLSLWLSRVDAFLLGKKRCPYFFFASCM